jgi:predicted ferric reductase
MNIYKEFSMNKQVQNDFNESSVNLQSLALFLLASFIGLVVAVLLLPIFLPNMAFSLSGDSPKAYWYLSRATAFISLSLLWLSMVLGLGITNKLARIWPGMPATFAIHEYVSLLGLAFALFHGLVILGDHYINFTLLQLVVPFSTLGYRPLWVGFGQISFYIWMIVVASFYARPLIGQKSWRLLHYASFTLYILGITHAIFSGTDTGMNWAQNYYWFSGGSLIFLFFVRFVGSLIEILFPAKRQTPVPPPAQG